MLEKENVNINFIHVSVIFEIEMLVYMVFEISYLSQTLVFEKENVSIKYCSA